MDMLIQSACIMPLWLEFYLDFECLLLQFLEFIYDMDTSQHKPFIIPVKVFGMS